MYDKSRIDKFTGGQESLSIHLELVRAETMNMLDQQNLSLSTSANALHSDVLIYYQLSDRNTGTL
jgi:hypothetical protein